MTPRASRPNSVAPHRSLSADTSDGAGARRRRFAAALTLVLATTIATSGCFKKDLEENFNLWSNNQAGWTQMSAFVADPKNDLEVRARALEVLTLNGHPSQVMTVVDKTPDKDKVLLNLRDRLGKVLTMPNEKMARYAKQVLFEMIPSLPDAEKEKTRKVIADWAFGDMSHDDQAKMVAEKLGRRMRPEEIEALSGAGVKGAEIMLAKGIARNEVMVYLQGVKTDEAKVALIKGLRLYHELHKNAKYTPAELGFAQRTEHVDGLLYFFWVYNRLIKSEHPDDKQAGSLAIAAAMEWLESDAGKKLLVDNYKEKFKPLAEELITHANCDDRWWAAQVMVRNEGVEGLKAVLAKMPEDTNYGNEAFANNDFKMMLMDLCLKDIAKIDPDKAREVLLASLGSKRVIERIIAIRCLLPLRNEAVEAALKKYDKKDNLIVDPIIVPHDAEEVTPYDLAQVVYDTFKYHDEMEALAAKGKLSPEEIKWRKFYASYSFERQGKKLRDYTASRAAEKIEAEKAEAAKPKQ